MSTPFSYFYRKAFFIKIFSRQAFILNHRMFCLEHTSTNIDSFTENLVLEKAVKWENILKLSDKHYTKSLPNSCECNIKETHYTQVIDKQNVGQVLYDSKLIIENINECVKSSDIPQLIKNLEQCKDKKYCPSKEHLLVLAKLFAAKKNKCGLEMLRHMCQINYPSEYKKQCCYDHFMAEIVWLEGNIKESLRLFGAVYCENVVLRKLVKIMICRHFSEIIANHGEASRIVVINFVKMIADKHNDYSLMGYFWKVLFESEWFSDQQLSSKFLKENPHLKGVIGWMLPTMGRQILQQNKVETFYRLIEVLLCNSMKQDCGSMLRLLFDYKCTIGDLKACTSIVKACADLDLPLTDFQEKKFICLLLKTPTKIGKAKEFNLKF